MWSSQTRSMCAQLVVNQRGNWKCLPSRKMWPWACPTLAAASPGRIAVCYNQGRTRSSPRENGFVVQSKGIVSQMRPRCRGTKDWKLKGFFSEQRKVALVPGCFKCSFDWRQAADLDTSSGSPSLVISWQNCIWQAQGAWGQREGGGIKDVSRDPTPRGFLCSTCST